MEKRFAFSEGLKSALKVALAKSETKTNLLTHLEDVGNRCGELSRLLWISPEVEEWMKENSLDKETLLGYLQLQGYLHDLGKLDSRFQAKIKGGSKKCPPHPLLSLQLLNAIRRPWKLTRGTELLEAMMTLSIATHHSDLYEGLYEDYRRLVFLNDSLRNNNDCEYLCQELPYVKFEKAKALIRKKNKKVMRTLYVLFNGTLRTADGAVSGSIDIRNTAFLNGDSPQSRLFSYMQNRGWKLYDYQETVAKNAGACIAFRLPCGTGKTEAALLACPKDAKKVFYTLPTVTTVEAMRHRLEGPSSSEGIFAHDEISYSHHLMALSLIEDDEYEKGALLANRYCMKKVVVTTIDHILLALMNGKHYPIIEVGLNNAYLIVDEIHSYSPSTMALILQGLRHLRRQHNTRIAVMSATLPSKITEYLKKEETGIGVVNPFTQDDTERLYRSKKRVRLDFSRIDEGIDTAFSEIVERYRRGESVLVVLNTVSAAVNAYRRLRDEFGLRAGSIRSGDTDSDADFRNGEGIGSFSNRADLDYRGDIFLIHSRYNLGDKRERISWLERFRERKRPLILVSTQVVEVSLDLDFDSMYSEAAPVDALVQRCGRVNRKGLREPGPVYLFKPRTEKPYEGYQIAETINRLCNQTLEAELDFLLVNDSYFDAIWNKYEEELGKEVFRNLSRIERERFVDNLLKTRDSFLTLPVIPIGDDNCIYHEILSTKQRLEKADNESRKKLYVDYLRLRLRCTVEAPIFVIGENLIQKRRDLSDPLFVNMGYSEEEGLKPLVKGALIY